MLIFRIIKIKWFQNLLVYHVYNSISEITTKISSVCNVTLQ